MKSTFSRLLRSPFQHLKLSRGKDLAVCNLPCPNIVFIHLLFICVFCLRRFDEVKQERVAKYQGMNLYIKNLVDEVWC